MESDELDVMEQREWRRMEAKSFKEGFRQELVSFLKPWNDSFLETYLRVRIHPAKSVRSKFVEKQPNRENKLKKTLPLRQEDDIIHENF